MTNSAAFLDGDPDKVGELLLQLARRERAPDAARERAFAGVAAAAVGAAVATSAKAALAAPSFTSSGGALAAKWLVVGLGGALVGLTTVDRVQRAFEPVEASSPPSPAAPARSAVQLPAPVAPSAAAKAPAVSDAPTAGAVDPVPRPPLEAPAPLELADAPASAPSSADFAAPDASLLAREVTALRRARTALADAKPSRALEILSAYRREFPAGVLGTEEAALRVEIAFALGDARAPELAERFLAQHGSSPLAARIASLLSARHTSRIKP